MKLQWKVLKNPKFIVGALVLFVVVLYMLNKSSASSSGVVTAAPVAPVDNTLALAQLGASVQNNQTAAAVAVTQDTNAAQIALATLQFNAQDYATNAAAQISALGITEQSHEADLAAQISALGIAANVTGMQLNYQTNIATITAAQNAAAMAYSSANYAIASNTQLQEYLANNQLAAYQTQTAASLVTSLAGRNKYSSIALPAYFNAVQPTSGNNAPSYIAPPSYPVGSLS